MRPLVSDMKIVTIGHYFPIVHSFYTFLQGTNGQRACLFLAVSFSPLYICDGVCTWGVALL